MSTKINNAPLPIRMTTAQRTGLTAYESQVIYDTDLHMYYFWNGSVWTAYA